MTTPNKNELQLYSTLYSSSTYCITTPKTYKNVLQLKNQSNPNSCIRVDDFDDNNDDVDAKRKRTMAEFLQTIRVETLRVANRHNGVDINAGIEQITQCLSFNYITNGLLRYINDVFT